MLIQSEALATYKVGQVFANHYKVRKYNVFVVFVFIGHQAFTSAHNMM